MNADDRIAVFNDEAHNTPAAEYDNTLFALKQISQIPSRHHRHARPRRWTNAGHENDFRVQHHRRAGRSAADHQEHGGLSAQTLLGRIDLHQPGHRRETHRDEMDEEFERIEKGLSSTQWVTDPDPMRKQIRIALDRLANRSAAPTRWPKDLTSRSFLSSPSPSKTPSRPATCWKSSSSSRTLSGHRTIGREAIGRRARQVGQTRQSL